VFWAFIISILSLLIFSFGHKKYKPPVKDKCHIILSLLRNKNAQVTGHTSL